MIPNYCFRPCAGFCDKFFKNKGLSWTQYSFVHSHFCYTLSSENPLLRAPYLYLGNLHDFVNLTVNVEVVCNIIFSEFLIMRLIHFLKIACRFLKFVPEQMVTLQISDTGVSIIFVISTFLCCPFVAHGLFSVQEHWIYSKKRKYCTFNWINICL